MATNEEIIKLKRQAHDYWKKMKQMLITQAQPWEARGRHNYSAHAYMGPNGVTHQRPGEFSIRGHQMPQDAEVTKYIEFTGGNPYLKKMDMLKRATGAAQSMMGGLGGTPGSVGAAAPDPSEMFKQVMASAQGKMDEANAANIARYDEGHGELSGVRARNQDRVQNWGHAASEDVNERMQEALDQQTAQLNATGIGNSNVLPAFQQRNARDNAREQQRISEMRDSRASEYDTRDTGNLVGFVERREDTGPDYNSLLSMAMQHGLAQQQQQNTVADREYRDKLLALQQQQANSGTGGRGVGVPGPQGGVMPFWAGANPVQLAGMMGMLPGNPFTRGPVLATPRASGGGVGPQPVEGRDYYHDAKRNQSRKPMPVIGPGLPQFALAEWAMKQKGKAKGTQKIVTPPKSVNQEVSRRPGTMIGNEGDAMWNDDNIMYRRHGVTPSRQDQSRVQYQMGLWPYQGGPALPIYRQ
jgi:hypothetical protein